MQLHEAERIMCTYSVNTVNEHLIAGWKLLNISPGTHDCEQQPCFTLGKPAIPLPMGLEAGTQPGMTSEYDPYEKP